MTGESPTEPFEAISESTLRERFEQQNYVADDRLITTVYLAIQLGRPLLVEGPPGSGKTELGKVLAEGFETELIRLQCYEGLTAENALYEWNYTKQLLAVQSNEGTVAGGTRADGQVADPDAQAGSGTDLDSAVSDPNGSGSGDGTGNRDQHPNASSEDSPRSIFDDEYLLERPLLRALTAGDDRSPVLLIDEIDRADEAFEAFLLELLSDYQVSIPELGVVSADNPPVVVLTSNRTRGLSDALKRRCLYLHVEPPSFETEYEIVSRKVPELDAAIAAEVCAVVERLREESFLKRPGVAETLDWARAVATLRADGDGESLSTAEIERTIGCLLKEVEDVSRVDTALLEQLRDAAATARDRDEPTDTDT
ncbi:AAA domain-containing protein [Natronorubrum sp. JWXQ-INN-674]|uniref:AAA domain-containing protein n=1 Tax=Natronorubrum halalkaliphilum TaxID=2691917 RepID=A0A6B0VTS8_9EURY|nr:MoxR family ATPase [Natronorubrum halalkaliphilum]MXV64162.1 AAA domain-containing protein [Natronorubrum halalkaliphilum]